MDIDKEEQEPEFKKKAAEAFKASAAAAKKLGGIACDLGKMGYSAAREKAKELGERVKEANRKAQEEKQAQVESENRRRMEEEHRRMEEERRRMEEERRRKAEWLAAGNRPAENGPSEVRRVEAARADKWRGDPEDKCFLMSYGWLYFIWWVGNVVYTVIALSWYVSMTGSYSTRGSAWIPIVFWLVALLFNRLAYEGAVALFEMVRHLRQIRDELRRHNMREEKRDRKAWEPKASGSMQGQSGEQDADGDEDMPNAEEDAEKTRN